MAGMLVGNVAELESRIGSEIAVGDWITVAQEQIDLFATATGDHQWIHIDVERAAAESPFGGTIAHGFLSLSLLSTGYDSSHQSGPERGSAPESFCRDSNHCLPGNTN
jgi:acyl dehydratase